jgi:hypothetical protein
MTSISGFRQVGSRGFYQPSGAVSFEQGLEGVAAAIAQARRLGLTDIVINTLGLGFSVPSVVDRYTLALRVVENAGSTLRVAFVARPEVIDSQKIGAVMVQNRGVISDTFATEAEALSWLDKLPRPPRQAAPLPDGRVPGDD